MIHFRLPSVQGMDTFRLLPKLALNFSKRERERDCGRCLTNSPCLSETSGSIQTAMNLLFQQCLFRQIKAFCCHLASAANKCQARVPLISNTSRRMCKKVWYLVLYLILSTDIRLSHKRWLESDLKTLIWPIQREPPWCPMVLSHIHKDPNKCNTPNYNEITACHRGRFLG